MFVLSPRCESRGGNCCVENGRTAFLRAYPCHATAAPLQHHRRQSSQRPDAVACSDGIDGALRCCMPRFLALRSQCRCQRPARCRPLAATTFNSHYHYHIYPHLSLVLHDSYDLHALLLIIHAVVLRGSSSEYRLEEDARARTRTRHSSSTQQYCTQQHYIQQMQGCQATCSMLARSTRT